MEKKIRRIRKSELKSIDNQTLYESLKPSGEGLRNIPLSLNEKLEEKVKGHYVLNNEKQIPIYNPQIWNDEWESIGRKYTIRGVYNLIKGSANEFYNFILDERVVKDLENFIKKIK